MSGEAQGNCGSGGKNKKKKTEKILFGTGGILLAGSLFLMWAARNLEGFADWYGQWIYTALVGTVGRFWGIFPFSVSEIGFYFLLAGIVFFLIRFRKRPVFLLSGVFFLFSLLLFSYCAACGVNYSRTPFSSYYLKDAAEEAAAGGVIGDETLIELCAWLTERTKEERLALDQMEGAYEDLQEKGVSAMENLAQIHSSLEGFYPKPKPFLLSWILSVQQCSGIYLPFTIEANYNQDMVSYNIPHTICHELSHLRGFMREDEANFIGYLACMNSEDEDFRYSGYLMGWIYAGNALAKTDYEAYIGFYKELPESVRADLHENSVFWNQYEGRTAEVANQVNNAYLKANGQSEGIKTYGRVVDLMLLDFSLKIR